MPFCWGARAHALQREVGKLWKQKTIQFFGPNKRANKHSFFARSLAHLHTSSLARSLVCSLARSLAHSLTCSLTRSLIRALAHPPIPRFLWAREICRPLIFPSASFWRAFLEAGEREGLLLLPDESQRRRQRSAGLHEDWLNRKHVDRPSIHLKAWPLPVLRPILFAPSSVGRELGEGKETQKKEKTKQRGQKTVWKSSKKVKTKLISYLYGFWALRLTAPKHLCEAGRSLRADKDHWSLFAWSLDDIGVKNKAIRCVTVFAIPFYYKSFTADRRTDGPTDGRTDTPSYIDARLT